MRYLKYYLIGLVGTLQEVALCEIQNAQIKEASKSFISTMNASVIGGGLLVSGILIFANNYKSGLSGIAATAFIYAAKAFTGTGEGTLLSSIDLLCR